MTTYLIIFLALLSAVVFVLYILKIKSAKKDSTEGQTFHRIFELANDPILVIDLIGGKVLESNKAACDLLGYSGQEILNKTL